MALMQALRSMKTGVLNRVSFPVAGGAAFAIYRGFAEGTYLNKDEVTERVLNVVKHFNKVDTSKVSFVGGNVIRAICMHTPYAFCVWGRPFACVLDGMLPKYL